jgi:hypothetical protein
MAFDNGALSLGELETELKSILDEMAHSAERVDGLLICIADINNVHTSPAGRMSEQPQGRSATPNRVPDDTPRFPLLETLNEDGYCVGDTVKVTDKRFLMKLVNKNRSTPYIVDQVTRMFVYIVLNEEKRVRKANHMVALIMPAAGFERVKIKGTDTIINRQN